MLSSISSSVLAISFLAASSLAASVPVEKREDPICSSLLQPVISVNGTQLPTNQTTSIQLSDVLKSEFYTGHGASCDGRISLGLALGDKAPDSIFSGDWKSSLKIQNRLNSVDLTPDYNTNCGNYTAFLFQYGDNGENRKVFYSAPVFVEGYYGRPNCTPLQ